MLIAFVETEACEHDYFHSHLPGHDLHFCPSLEDVPAGAEAISIFIYSHVDELFLEKHQALRLIVTRSTSHAHIDLPACKSRGIAVCAIDSYGECTVAEHTFALILAVARRLPEAAEAHRKERFSYKKIRGVELRNKTLGLAGLGRVGRRVVQIGLAFEMKILAHDIHPFPLENVRFVEKQELVASSDVLSLHLPSNPQTFHYLDNEAFSLLRRGSIVINTSGGGLIDTEALIDALDQGVVSGAGLDSLEEERVVRQEAMGVIADQIVERVRSAPEEDEAHYTPGRLCELRRLTRNETLLGKPQVLFTPHTAFNCHEAVERVNQTTIQALQRFAAGEPLAELPEVDRLC